MPITDHEKRLQVHSRSPSDFLMAVPIKKRRFLFARSPSPPPKPSSPTQADDDIAESKHASSELGVPSSKTGTNSAHANVVEGKVASCEYSNLQPAMAEDFRIPEKKPESSELGSPFSITAGNPAQVNSVTGQLDSPAECFMSEKKPQCPRNASSFSTIEGNPIQVNAVAGENASSELPRAAADCGLSEMMTEPSEQPGSPFSKSGVNSAPVKAKTGEDASHEHCEFAHAKPTHSGAIEKKHEPLSRESPLSKNAGYSSQVNFAKVTNASSESREKPIGRDVNICPKSEILQTLNDQVFGLNLASTHLDGTRIAHEMAFTSQCAAWSVSGSMATHSATKETLAPGRGGNMEGKLTQRDGISVKPEVSELHNLHSTSSDSKAKTDASCLCPNRSNWDLNTTMDAWEGSSARPLSKNGDADFARQGVSGIPGKRLDVGLNQMLAREPIGMDMTLENHLVRKDNRQLNLPNRSTSVVDSNSEACLDLQLRPFSLPNLSNISRHYSSRDAPFLSLGMKHMPITSGLPVAAGGTVKSEPVENNKADAGKIQSGVLKSLDLKQVKSELRERQEISKAPSPGKMNAACSVVIKQEPLGDQSQGYVKSGTGSLFSIAQNCHTLDTPSIQMHLNAGIDEDRALDVASKSLIVNSMLHPRMDKPNINIPNDSSGMIDKAQALVNQASIPGNHLSNISLTNESSDMVDKAKCLADKASIPGDDFSFSTQSPSLLAKPLISYRKDTNSVPESCETSTLPVALLPDSSTSTGDGQVSLEGVPKLAVQMDALSGHHSCHESLTNGVLGKPCDSSKIVNSGVVEDKDGASSEVLEESNSTCKSDGSHVAAGAVNPVRKQCGKDDEDFEDGEVRNPALNGTCEGSIRVTEEREVKAVGSFCPADASVLATLLGDEEAKVATSKEADILGSKESDGGLPENKVEPSSSPASALTADSGKKGPIETNRRIPNDHLENDNVLESNFKYGDTGRKRSPSSADSSKQQDVDGHSLVRSNVSPETEPPEKEGTKKDASDRGDNGRIIYLNSVFNSLASEKRKSDSDMSISSPEEREIHADRSFRRERSRSHGSRDEIYNERSRKVETERHYGHPAEKSRSEFLRNRSRTDRLDALHGNRNPNPDRLLERINSSNGVRYSRRASAAEVAIGASHDGSNRLARRVTREERQNQTRLPCQRRSPGGRGQMPSGCHPKRGFSPSRRVERDAPDFVLQAHEDKFLRNMHELEHPRSQYGRAEGILLHRERRSLSPQRRRGGPLQISPNCAQSSPRSQQRSTPHWSPSARTSDGFNGQREMERCRSPPPVRISRMQSPHERRRFPEEVMVRRRGSPQPPFHARLPDDMVDADPSREHDFPRLVRDSSRNMRRFNTIDPREMMQEEYFGPPLVHSQIREFGVDDGFVDDRRGDERRGPVRSFRQRCVAGDDEGESFQFIVEDGRPRAIRLRPASDEGFPEGSGRRNFDARFRNRLGNPSVRMRDVAQEQEDSYRHHGEEWQDTTFNDGRPKRRRF